MYSLLARRSRPTIQEHVNLTLPDIKLVIKQRLRDKTTPHNHLYEFFSDLILSFLPPIAHPK